MNNALDSYLDEDERLPSWRNYPSKAVATDAKIGPNDKTTSGINEFHSNDEEGVELFELKDT